MRPIRILSALAAAVAFAAGCTGTDELADQPQSTPSVTAADSAATTSATATTAAAPATAAPTTAAAATTVAATPLIPGFPHTLDGPGGTWTLDEPPQRIVSLSPSTTEILFAIGAGDQVVAVDDYSTYPAAAPTTDLSGWDPNVEAVLTYEPDLVLIANDANDIVAALNAAGVPIYINAAPVDLEAGYAGIIALGDVTGHADAAAELVVTMRSEMEAALGSAPAAAVRLFHELDDTHYSVSSFSFIGAVYAEFGVENIADPADSDGWGYPQLTPEYIVDSDPEVIVITDLVGYGAHDVAARPGWNNVTAVRNGNIVVVNADIASRWGPRLPQFAAIIAEALAKAVAQ